MTPAQKAAKEICDAIRNGGFNIRFDESVAGIIQRSIDEAIAERVKREMERYGLAGALAMKEKCAIVLSTSPQKVIYECAAHIRTNVKPVAMKEIVRFLPQADSELESLAKGEK